MRGRASGTYKEKGPPRLLVEHLVPINGREFKNRLVKGRSPWGKKKMWEFLGRESFRKNPQKKKKTVGPVKKWLLGPAWKRRKPLKKGRGLPKRSRVKKIHLSERKEKGEIKTRPLR